MQRHPAEITPRHAGCRCCPAGRSPAGGAGPSRRPAPAAGQLKTNSVVRWTEFGRGRHFAALEAPDLLAADVREFFASLT
ncbi:MAG TPA: hypothetical protein VGG35_07905 [Streptosporangiaceae bacterium]